MPEVLRQVRHRTPPLISRWTRNRRGIPEPGAAPPPPPPPDYEVKGDGAPSPNGDYYQNGTYWGRPAYELEAGGHWLWWKDDLPLWVISKAIADTTYFWYAEPDQITGTYYPIGECSGNPVVQVP